MLKRQISSSAACALLMLAGVAHSQQQEAFSARQYADPATGLLDENRAARYIVARDGIPFEAVTTNDRWDVEKAKEFVGDKLDDLITATRSEAPWRWQDLDEASPAELTEDETEAAKPAWQKIVGITKPVDLDNNADDLVFGPVLGPIRIRQSTDDLTQADLDGAKGATVGYSNNRLVSGGGAWNSTGAIDYPFKWRREGGPGTGKSTTIEVSPAFDWNLSQAQGGTGTEVEEANISVPFTIYRSPGTDYSALWVAQGRPYLQTDFSGGHRIYGVEASLEFVGRPFGQELYVGGFQNLGIGNLQYQLRVIPKLNYSEVDRTGIHSTRVEGDDWFRLGGLASLDLRTGSENPLDLGASYEFFSTASGDGDSSSVFEAYTTWWLSKNTGMTFKYQRGDTPVAAQEIDLLTLGLEFKY